MAAKIANFRPVMDALGKRAASGSPVKEKTGPPSSEMNNDKAYTTRLHPSSYSTS